MGCCLCNGIIRRSCHCPQLPVASAILSISVQFCRMVRSAEHFHDCTGKCFSGTGSRLVFVWDSGASLGVPGNGNLPNS